MTEDGARLRTKIAFSLADSIGHWVGADVSFLHRRLQSDLAIDQIDAICMAIDLEDRFDVDINDNELDKLISSSATIAEVITYVQRAIEQKSCSHQSTDVRVEYYGGTRDAAATHVYVRYCTHCGRTLETWTKNLKDDK